MTTKLACKHCKQSLGDCNCGLDPLKLAMRMFFFPEEEGERMVEYVQKAGI